VVAVLGADDDPSRAGFYVPACLAWQRYRVLPVNPVKVGQTLFGEPVRASLGELAEPVDVVDVFRRPDALAGHLSEVLAIRPLPTVVWLQSGISEDEFADKLVAAGIDVVQDQCMLALHRAWF